MSDSNIEQQKTGEEGTGGNIKTMNEEGDDGHSNIETNQATAMSANNTTQGEEFQSKSEELKEKQGTVDDTQKDNVGSGSNNGYDAFDNISSGSNQTTVEVFEVLYEVRNLKSYLPRSYEQTSKFFDSSRKEKSKTDFVLEEGWHWVTDWKTESKDAWEYARRWEGPYSYAENILLDHLKRRKWYRVRLKTGVTDKELRKLKKTKEGMFRIVGTSSDVLHSKLDGIHKQLQTNIQVVSEKVKRPNILLLGGSGAGKSSLINAVFGKPLAEIGEGKPITQHYTKYSGKHSPVLIYDSKGIEHGSIENGFVADTKKFFKKLTMESELENHIHVVWYVIDLTQARFQPFEADFCKNILKDIPIIFVLNKSDAVSMQTEEVMRKTVADFHLPNCRGIFSTVANCKNFDRKDCPKCGTIKIKKQLKQGKCTIICKECKEKTIMLPTMGIQQLSEATLSCLPTLLKDTFYYSQRAKIMEKEKKAKQLILNSLNDASFSKPDLMEQAAIKLTDHLVNLYEANLIKDRAISEVKRKFAIIFSEQNILRRAQFFFGDLFTKPKFSIGHALMVTIGLEVAKTLITFHSLTTKSAFGSPTIPTETGSSIESSTSSEKLQTTNHHTNDLNIDKEVNIRKIIANLYFAIDIEQMNKILGEIKKYDGIPKYLDKIVIDGESSYITQDLIDQVYVEEDDDFVPVSYQNVDAKNQSPSSQNIESESKEAEKNSQQNSAPNNKQPNETTPNIESAPASSSSVKQTVSSAEDTEKVGE